MSKEMRDREVEKIRSMIRGSRAGQALFLELVPEILDHAYNSIAEHLVDSGVRTVEGFEPFCCGCCEFKVKDILGIQNIDYTKE